MINSKSLTIILLNISLILFTSSVFGQKVDTVKIAQHSPRKAVLMSAIIPGLGQAYNHKYWKIPIIYAGFAAVVYFQNFNNLQYRDFHFAYEARTAVPPRPDNYPNLSTSDLLDNQTFYRRDLELTYVIGGLLYLVNILDAAVDANLFDYNLNDNLTLKLSPVILTTYDNNINFALSIKFKIR